MFFYSRRRSKNARRNVRLGIRSDDYGGGKRVVKVLVRGLSFRCAKAPILSRIDLRIGSNSCTVLANRGKDKGDAFLGLLLNRLGTRRKDVAMGKGSVSTAFKGKSLKCIPRGDVDEGRGFPTAIRRVVVANICSSS